MAREISYDKDVRESIKKGVNKLFKAVSTTLGGRGRNVLIQSVTGEDYQITKDGVTVAKAVELKDQLENLACKVVKQASLSTNEEVGDGCQPLHSKVLTPKGWEKMGDLKIGDFICGTNGVTQKILNIFKKGEKNIYEVVLSDGSKTLCDDSHIWNVTTNYGVNKNLSTRQLIEGGKIKYKRNNGNLSYGYYLPNTYVDFFEQKLPIDPYLLGVLLGDGSLSSNTIEISLGYKKEYIIDKLILPSSELYLKVTDVPEKNYKRLKIQGVDSEKGSMKKFIKDLKLNVNSKNKFIPNIYKYNSVYNRNQLLRGLIDTDGHINKRGLFEFTTISESLKNDFVELCKGLGIQINVSKIDKSKHDSYSDSIIYRITELKGYKYGRKLVAINNLGYSEEVQCLKVSNDDSLYITDDYIVTHNTTTSIVLANSMVETGIDFIEKEVNPISMKRGMDKATAAVVEYLKNIAKPVEGDTEFIKQIATVSANGDTTIGGLIAKAFEVVGKHGVIKLDQANVSNHSITHSEGLGFDRGYIHPIFTGDINCDNVELENPYILVTDYLIKDFSDFKLKTIQQANGNVSNTVELFEELKAENRPLLIICDDMDIFPAQFMGKAMAMRDMINVVVKAPEFGHRRSDVLGDIAASIGATFITKDAGLKLEDVTLDMLGSAKSVLVTANETTISSGNGKKEDVDARITSIKKALETEDQEFAISKLEERLAKLTGGIATLNIGAKSEVELKEIKDRVEDALNATKAAIAEGVVAGGGIALFNAVNSLKSIETEDEDEQKGVEIIAKAVINPLYCILENAGEANADLIDKIINSKNTTFGYDVKARKFVDMFEAGIIDPVKVTRTALENASSIVGTLLTTECTIYNGEKEIDPLQGIL